MPYIFYQGCAKSIFNAGRRRLQFACSCFCVCMWVCIGVLLCVCECTCLCALIMKTTCILVSYSFVHTFPWTCGCVSVYMCSVALRRPVCLTQHILRSLSSALSLSPLPLPLFPPSSPSHSARLARTCMSVDSVLCLLPWHAPTSLQCSPVCINWQRDSGYVVCRAGRIEKREKGEARRGNVRTQ